MFADCEEEDGKEICYQTIDLKLETAIFEMSSEVSVHLVFDFGNDPMNAMPLPLEENKYWDGEISSLTISGDLGGVVDIKKPQLSICPDFDCDKVPEMQEAYSGLTDAIQELHVALDATDNLEPSDRDDLVSAIDEIRAVLGDEDASPQPDTLGGRFSAAIERFEDRHPDLTKIMGRVADALSEMGI